MKWGILATGTIARKFAQTINQMDGETLVAVGSRRADSARTFADQFAIPRAHDSYEALAADPEVECVYIATPNALHYENCKLCLEHGKHVLCEKPFTIDPAQAESLYRLAAAVHGAAQAHSGGRDRPAQARRLSVWLRRPGGQEGPQVQFSPRRRRAAGHRHLQPGLFAAGDRR